MKISSAVLIKEPSIDDKLAWSINKYGFLASVCGQSTQYQNVNRTVLQQKCLLVYNQVDDFVHTKRMRYSLAFFNWAIDIMGTRGR